MDPIIAFVLLGILLVIAWIVAKFFLRLTARIIGCVLTAIVAVGIIIIIVIFFL